MNTSYDDQDFDYTQFEIDVLHDGAAELTKPATPSERRLRIDAAKARHLELRALVEHPGPGGTVTTPDAFAAAMLLLPDDPEVLRRAVSMASAIHSTGMRHCRSSLQHVRVQTGSADALGACGARAA